MSRAFVKEPDGDAVEEELPDRAISTERNLVTPSGHRHIEEQLAHWRALEADTDVEDRAAHARIGREVRYWSSRWASAEVIEPPADPETVVFATTVDVRRADGHVQTISIVGEDESAPEEGRIAWTAPLAHVLIGLAEGERAKFRDEEMEVVAIRQLA